MQPEFRWLVAERCVRLIDRRELGSKLPDGCMGQTFYLIVPKLKTLQQQLGPQDESPVFGGLQTKCTLFRSLLLTEDAV